ncbi:hypothetical protein BC828DRAFT_407502 [Blastocladiella britannica]|nr:hypothetical protein BC828DRAFT_407502 [Blastocladiella britannica]
MFEEIDLILASLMTWCDHSADMAEKLDALQHSPDQMLFVKPNLQFMMAVLDELDPMEAGFGLQLRAPVLGTLRV